MTAQPLHHQEDPQDPQVILRDLPQREREEFLRQYQAAVDAARRDVSRYKDLRQLLRHWSLVVVATNLPEYYENLDAVRGGTATTVPAHEAVPDWEARIAAARAAR
jgi:hypothetical protein